MEYCNTVVKRRERRVGYCCCYCYWLRAVLERVTLAVSTSTATVGKDSLICVALAVSVFLACAPQMMIDMEVA